MIKSVPFALGTQSPLLLGIVFLVFYWIWGYDGITFSDEVAYLQLGHQLWSNESVVSDYHFTSRWGAFLFSGLFTNLLGFSDRYGSIATLIFYLLTLSVLWRVTPSGLRKWAVLFFIGNVYLLHFLTKVYPDGFLILWVTLIPAAAVWRHDKPFAAACVMVTSFFIGFCTKETIVFLAPFPLLLFLADLRGRHSLNFYYYSGGIAVILAILYFGYYQWQFGDWLYRFKSVNEGHYISEYTYHDKGLANILKRITYLPILTFIERTYWLWWIMALPGIYYGIKKKDSMAFEFGASALCLLIGFWFMTSTLEFYNPIYLNPRHLIILVAPLSICIALGAKYWLHSLQWKRALALLLSSAGMYSIIFADWKVGLFYILFSGILFLRSRKIQFTAMAFGLVLPVLFSVYYQHQLKNYAHFSQSFRSAALGASDTSPLLTHDFIYFSREVLLQEPQVQRTIVSMAQMESLIQNPPEALTLFVYSYYRHAYPAEQLYLDKARKWINDNYVLTRKEENQWIGIENYNRQAADW
jgi:hypothetical protein